jgi:hypothetical protein
MEASSSFLLQAWFLSEFLFFNPDKPGVKTGKLEMISA